MKDAKKLNDMRHSWAHVLAQAVRKFYPKAKLGIGPTIEDGFYYDFDNVDLSENDLAKIEKEMRIIAKKNLNIKKEIWPIKKTKEYFKEKNANYKLELIESLIKNDRIKEAGIVFTGKGTEDEFIDLCRGGHIKNTKELNTDAFKLMRVAGAYWRGDEKNPMLTRIYGVAFETKKELEKYLWQQEEAKKRDHRILGTKLKLFTFADEVGPGLPLWLPNGTVIREELETYAKKIETQWGYRRVATPHIAKETLYKMSGHIPYYADDMYPPMKLDDGNYYLKAMNCPHTHMIYKSEPRSYKDLPLRLAEYGTVYRYELSGVLAGLLRVRGFTQNDAHIYCREDQAEEEFLTVMKLHEFWYKKVFRIKDFYMRLSLPSKDSSKYANTPNGWSKSVKIIRSAMKKSGLPYTEVTGEAAFYGPKVDFQIKSVIGREESASTNQLDFLATERFNLDYTDKNGNKKPIYVIHRSPLGSHERFIAFLIEHFAGAFPVWLSPAQVWVLPISDSFKKYGEEIIKKLKENNLRAELRDEAESLGKKIRNGQIQKIPYLLIVGEKEKKASSVSVRHREKGDVGTMKVNKFIEKVLKEIADKK